MSCSCRDAGPGERTFTLARYPIASKPSTSYSTVSVMRLVNLDLEFPSGPTSA